MNKLRLNLPKYYIVYDRLMKMVRNENDRLTVLELNEETGLFEVNMKYIDKIFFGKDDVEKVSEDEFIQEVEAIRGRNLKGEGAVYDLYEVINGMEDTAKEEGRKLTPKEQAIIIGLRKKTYQLFEAMSKAQ